MPTSYKKKRIERKRKDAEKSIEGLKTHTYGNAGKNVKTRTHTLSYIH